MPIVTTLGQRCTVYLDGDDVQRFKIESSIDQVLAGDLPLFGLTPFSSRIFVHQIIDTADPKADVFLRVGNVADLTTLAQGREDALVKSQALYVSTEFTVVYDDVATASTAKVLIQQRVDNLIADWHTYNEKFLNPLTSPPDTSDIPLPLTESEEAARKAAYNTAHAELLVAKAATTLITAECVVHTNEAAAANTATTTAVADSQAISTILGQFNLGKTAVDAYRSAVNVFMAAAGLYGTYVTPTGGQTAIFNAAYTTMTAAVTAEALNGAPILTNVHTGLATYATSKISTVQTAAADKTAADDAAATCATEKKAAAQAEAAAQIADTLALLAVKELCPDFVATIP